MQKNNPYLIDIGQGLSIMVGLPTLESWDNDKRPEKAKKGTFGFNSETNSLEYWDGSNWYTAKMFIENK